MYNLFQVFGVEMEYMIVDRQTLNVKPIADLLIKAVEGEVVSETDQGELAWCNELVSHVIELKTNGPAKDLSALTALFQRDVRRINQILEEFDACLMPTATHPWMDPFKETKLWDHEYNEIYESFNKIFDCRGHGWANLQSTHLNLPFAGDDEFGRLHAAIRAILPILPVLSASSPVMDAKVTGILDNRLAVYRTNAKRVPSVSGYVIPEPCYTEQAYRTELLQKIYDDIAPLDPDGILQEEWLNARGAIARFDRNAIEIRVLDLQEHPGADIAILQFIIGVIKSLLESKWQDVEIIKQLDTIQLSTILTDTTEYGGETILVWPDYLKVFGVGADSMPANQLWMILFDQLEAEIWPEGDPSREIIKMILEKGNLSERIVRKLGKNPTKDDLFRVYDRLRVCLQEGIMLV